MCLSHKKAYENDSFCQAHKTFLSNMYAQQNKQDCLYLASFSASKMYAVLTQEGGL
jgi:hypothetical protein